jgi:hypothetical protein
MDSHFCHHSELYHEDNLLMMKAKYHKKCSMLEPAVISRSYSLAFATSTNDLAVIQIVVAGT